MTLIAISIRYGQVMLTNYVMSNKLFRTTFNFRAINEGDLQKAMAEMKIKISFGNDNISGYFLKIAFAVISSSLLKIFNVSIETNTFPEAWKIASHPDLQRREKVRKIELQIHFCTACHIKAI